ncbi:MAG: glycosyltransferase family 4 protein [Planctomycetota bacterium]
MRVVFITHYTNLYGANRSLLDLLDGLKEFKVQSQVVCPWKGEILEALEKRNIEFSVIPFRGWFGSKSIESRLKKPARLVTNLAAIPRLSRCIRQWDPDIIYTNSSVTPVGAWTSHILHKPHIWHIREMLLLHYKMHYDWGEKIFKRWLNKADAVITISRAVKQAVCNDLQTRIYTLHDGVIFSGDPLLSIEPKYSSRNYTFAIVGVTSPNKGQDQALRAVAELRKDFSNIRLLVVGSDAKGYTNKLKELAVELNVSERVDFLGYMSNPLEAYKASDAVLMCSKHEAMGRVTAEAMAAARPVIGYNSGATPEIIDNEVTGIIYDGGHQKLAQCMKRFIEEPRWAQQLGINGRRKAQKDFSVEVYARRVYEVLQEVAKTPASG